MKEMAIDVAALRRAHEQGFEYAMLLLDTYCAGLKTAASENDFAAVRRAVRALRDLPNRWTPYGTEP